MGGKTQQRVAGNVKPTSSRRIRDLLMNKQLGVGNIITFSTLSSNSTEGSSSTISEPNVKSNQPELAHQSSVKEDKELSTPETSSTDLVSDDKPALLVKRVGNRDYFTRVKVAKDPSDLDVPRKVFPFPGENNSSISSPLSTNAVSSDEEKIKDIIEHAEASLENKHEEVSSCDSFSSILDQIEEYKSSNSPLKVKSLDEIEDDRCAKEENFIELLMSLIKNFKEDLSIEEWDLINQNLNNWIHLILNSNNLSGSLARTKFCAKVFTLINNLVNLATTLRHTENIEEEFPMLKMLLDDWENFYSTNAYQDLIALYFRLVSKPDQLSHEEQQIIKALASIVIDVNPKSVLANRRVLDYLRLRVDFDSEFELPQNIRYCDIDETKFEGFSAICNLLRSNYRIITVTAHTMLSKIMSSICNSSEISVVTPDQDDVDEFIIVPPKTLMTILTSRDSMMSALLSDYRDISVTIEPKSDSYTCVLAYLFV